MNIWRTSVFACLALGALAACSKPASNPPVAGNSGVAQSQEPLPEFPAWSLAYLGKSAKDALPQAGACLGHLDALEMTYVGPKPGTKVYGWAWDSVHAKPVDRVLLVDSTGKIVGAGEGGAARPDVAKAVAAVTSGVTGFKASTQLTAGAVDAIAIVAPDTGCALPGRVALQ